MDIRINASFGMVQLLIWVSAVATRMMNGTTGKSRIPVWIKIYIDTMKIRWNVQWLNFERQCSWGSPNDSTFLPFSPNALLTLFDNTIQVSQSLDMLITYFLILAAKHHL